MPTDKQAFDACKQIDFYQDLLQKLRRGISLD